MKSEQQNDLKCTFEDAERNHLLDGMRMNTHDKIQSFEDMLDFAWQSGVIKQLRESVPVSL
ncbi:MAG: hypothetical protein ACRESC_03440 [Gammaproteobacteria bacterium]